MIASTVQPLTRDLPEFYRIGMTASLDPALGQLEWFGRGPPESYVDRKASAAVGLYHGDIAEQFHDYTRPQETGNKVDVRWATLKNGHESGLLVVGMPLLSLTALPFDYAELDYRPGAQKHGATSRHAQCRPRADGSRWRQFLGILAAREISVAVANLPICLSSDAVR